MEINKNAICGNCGKKFVDHYHEEETFCFENTNGDLFTDIPNDDLLISFLEETEPLFLENARLKWRRVNGHLVE